MKKIKLVSFIMLLCFIICGANYVKAATNNEIGNTVIYDNFIGSTTVTWGGSQWDQGVSVGVDSDENVIMVGYSETSTGYNLTIVKYDSYFNYLWNVTVEIGNLDKPHDVVIDDLDNIFVACSIWEGPTPSNQTTNVFLLKYNSNGNQQWNQTWETKTHEIPLAMTLDAASNLYVTGSSTGTLGSTFILKYDIDGVFLWNNSYGEFENVIANDIAVNSTDIFLTGYIEYPYMTQLFLGKFGATGDNTWTKTVGGFGTTDIGKGLIVTGEDIYIVGQTESLADYLTDSILLKYNSTGEIQWYEVRDEELGNSIALRPDGNIVIAGDIGSSPGVFLVEYSPTGFTRWNTTWTGGATDNCFAVVAGAYNLYLVGQTTSFGSGDFDMLLVTFQPFVTVTLPPVTVTNPDPGTDLKVTINLVGQVLLWTMFALLLLLIILLAVFFLLYMLNNRHTTTTRKAKPKAETKTIIKEVPVVKTVVKEKIITKEGPPGPEKRPEDDPLTLESDIDDSPEVGPATHRQFQKLKIKKVKDFMAKTPEEIVEKLNKNGYTRLKVDDIKRMQTEAQLMIDIPPLRVHDAVILFKVGIKSRTALAKSDQDELWEKVQGVVDDSHVRKFLRWSNLEPTYEEIGEWIEAGKEALK